MSRPDEMDEAFDALVRLDGYQVAECMREVVAEVNANESADFRQRMIVVGLIVDRLNAAIARRDAGDHATIQ